MADTTYNNALDNIVPKSETNPISQGASPEMTEMIIQLINNPKVETMLKEALGIDLRPALEDGKLDDIEAKGLMGTVGNYLVSLGVIDAPTQDQIDESAKKDDTDPETATGIAAIKADPNFMQKAIIHYVSETQGLDKDMLNDSFERGQNFDFSPPTEAFKQNTGTPDEFFEFDETGNIVTPEPENIEIQEAPEALLESEQKIPSISGMAMS